MWNIQITNLETTTPLFLLISAGLSIVLTIIIFSIYNMLKKVRNKFKKGKKGQKNSHQWRKKSAKAALQKLQNFKYDGQRFSYLRKIDAFVFEEMILSAISQHNGIKIIEANAYTGDGGIDGTFLINSNGKKKKVLIQAKRYSGYINNKHIQEFCGVIDRERASYGLFVHTGKTGKASKEKVCGKVSIISGSELITLLFQGNLPNSLLNL